MGNVNVRALEKKQKFIYSTKERGQLDTLDWQIL